MRFSTLFTALTLCCGLALAADGPQAATYVEGNLPGLAGASAATLDVSGPDGLELNTGTETIKVPWADIASVQVGDSKSFSNSEEPYYKVWTLHKRLFDRTTLQQVSLDFTADGAERNMTVELEKSAADEMVKTLRERLAPYAKARRDANWWGDSIWKTGRNEDKWGGAGTLAARE